MKALVLTGVKEFEIQDLPTPEIQPNEVLINTAYAGVCGTDHDPVSYTHLTLPTT